MEGKTKEGLNYIKITDEHFNDPSTLPKWVVFSDFGKCRVWMPPPGRGDMGIAKTIAGYSHFWKRYFLMEDPDNPDCLQIYMAYLFRKIYKPEDESTD